MSGSHLSNLLTGVLTVCALLMTAVVVRREFGVSARTTPGVTATNQPDWRVFAAEGHVIGNPAAPVTIVEFADFECPYCRRFSEQVDSIRLRGRDFRLVYRHFPLRNHRFAIPAARASECAAEQLRFTDMHSQLYANADSLGLVSWWWYAKRAGVGDSVAFHRCTQSSRRLAALNRDTIAGNRLGVRGTPTILINDLRLDGVPPLDTLLALIDRAQQQSIATPAKSRDGR